MNDAPFIYKIRNSSQSSPFLFPTPSLAHQQNYMRKYEIESDNAYFVICDKNNMRKGTTRLHDPSGGQCSWGSWVLHENNNPAIMIESILLTLYYATEVGFSKIKAMRKKENHSMKSFYSNILEISESYQSESICYYFLDKAKIESLMKKYKKFLPATIEIDYKD